MKYTDINAKTWDRWSDAGFTWTKPISHEEYLAASEDNYVVYLTPCVAVPHEWFGDLAGKKLLGLASGGGQQMPIFAKLGADCTLLDYSERQLNSDRMAAEREGYDIEIIRGDMTKRLPFDDNTFDIIFHPVSNCYIEDVQHVWNECYRVLKPGGVLLAGMDNVNFVSRYPDRVSVLYLDAPVMNLLSCPMGFGVGESLDNGGGWQELVNAYSFTISSLLTYREHPIDRIPTLIAHKIPVHLSLVTVTPSYHITKTENCWKMHTAKKVSRCSVKEKSCGHHPHGLEDTNGIFSFIRKYIDA